MIGAGQGLFLALYSVEVGAALRAWAAPESNAFFVAGSAIALALTTLGLLASFFHLGHPERAWRTAAMWRTSWLSREVIALPAFMALLAAYGLAHYLGAGATLAIGAAGVLLCLTLFVCTGMIYACLKFLQEWHTPLTLINYFLLGSASGFMLATAFSAYTAPAFTGYHAAIALVLTIVASIGRTAALVRNARLKPTSTLQTALGIKHPRIVQKSQGFMGDIFSTREFFHGKTRAFVRAIKWLFLLLVCPLPLALLALGIGAASPALLVGAFVVQYIGLLAERWFFFAQANHPQNLYYQAIS